MSKWISLLIALCVCGLVSCAPISKKGKEDLKAPIRCDSAKRDISILEHEKKNVAQQVSAGVQDIHPAFALIHLFKGEYKDGWTVATGKYDKMIDTKIKEIKTTCNVS